MTMPNIALSIAEAQQLCGLGRTRLYELINSGQIPARKLGRRTLILHADLETFLQEFPSYHHEIAGAAQ